MRFLERMMVVEGHFDREYESYGGLIGVELKS
jgi:hypothetical protein